jgi:hypothetical protein
MPINLLKLMNLCTGKSLLMLWGNSQLDGAHWTQLCREQLGQYPLPRAHQPWKAYLSDQSLGILASSMAVEDVCHVSQVQLQIGCSNCGL